MSEEVLSADDLPSVAVVVFDEFVLEYFVTLGHGRH